MAWPSAVGLCEGLVAGARSRGPRSRRAEEWQRREAINERKKLLLLLREANEEHEKQRVATKRQAREQCVAAQWMLLYALCL